MNNNKMTNLEKSWIMYDMGNSAFILLVSTIIPLYFKSIANANGVSPSDSTAYWGYALSISTLIVFFLGPILGVLGDNKGYKKPLFTLCMMIGVISCALLSIPTHWILFLAVFVIAKVGFSSSLIFYDSMLVDVTSDDRVDQVSSHGYAWGYLGSCAPFIFSLVLILFSDKIGISNSLAMVITFLLNSIWWLFITIPLLKSYKQIYYVEPCEKPISDSFNRLKNIFNDLKENKTAFWFLVAFFFYIDGVYTIIEMSTAYGNDVGLTSNDMLFALLLTQLVAFPCALLFSRFSKKYEVKSLISLCIVAYFSVAIFALQLDKAWEFWLLATIIGIFQGAIQALSRSYFAKLIPKHKASEYFGLFDIFGKGASFLGTFIMGLSTQTFDTSKAGVVVIAGMFIIGFLVLHLKCNTEEAMLEIELD